MISNIPSVKSELQSAKVTALTEESLSALRAQYGSTGPRASVESDVALASSGSSRSSEEVMAAAQIGKSFLLEWEGTRTPPSTQIAGLQLGFLRRDIAYAQDGSQIGAYERLVDGGGDSANQHKVIVHLEGISLREMRDALTADTLPEPQRELILSALRKFLSPVSESQIQGFVESWAGNLNSDEFRKAENRQFALCIEIECEQLGVDVRASLGLPAVTLDSRF